MQEHADQRPTALNIPLPTLGGKQLWTDHRWHMGWRLQQNALTGHWRVLDRRNIRRAWGTRRACERILQQQAPSMDLPDKHAIILLHGLMRSASSMQPLEQRLVQERMGTPILFSYASSRHPVSAHALALRELVEGLPPDCRLSFVGHSLGNIVVRHAIGDWQKQAARPILNRIENVVMLGPPNQGAVIARKLSRIGIFSTIVGRSGIELGPAWEEFAEHLAIPPCRFGIIAGNVEERLPKNPLLPSHGDLIVTVDEARLEGAADFMEVPCMHTWLMNDAAVQDAVVQFLRLGKFSAGGPTTPEEHGPEDE